MTSCCGQKVKVGYGRSEAVTEMRDALWLPIVFKGVNT
jgi:hypothetical protein